MVQQIVKLSSMPGAMQKIFITTGLNVCDPHFLLKLGSGEAKIRIYLQQELWKEIFLWCLLLDAYFLKLAKKCEVGTLLAPKKLITIILVISSIS